MSKSPKVHSYDGIATDALRAIFPKEWFYKSPADIYSRREHGEDWIIEIVDEQENATGIEFSIQNKVNPKIRKEYVLVTGIKLSTLKRLIELNRPVLLHAYHHESKTSYWLWLDEWYAKNHASSWKTQKTVSVQIPKENILNDEAVKLIRGKVTWEHKKQSYIKRAQLITETNPDYRVEVSTGPNSITAVFNGKHNAAIPVIRPLDVEANNALQIALQTGLPMHIPGIVAVDGVPDLLGDEGSHELVDAFVFPNIPDETFPLRIEYLDENDEVLFKTPFVLMRLVQPGSIIRSWEGRSSEQGITYKFTRNSEHETLDFSIRAERKSQAVASWKEFFDLKDTLKPARRLKITELETDCVYYHDAKPAKTQEMSFEESTLRQLINYLSIVETHLGVSLQIPDRVDNTLVEQAHFAATAVLEGIVVVDGEEVVPPGHALLATDAVSVARDLVNIFEQNGTITIFVREAEFSDELCGQMLNLGLARYEFSNSKIINVDELKAKFNQNAVSETELVTIAFAIDKEDTRIHFLDWPKG